MASKKKPRSPANAPAQSLRAYTAKRDFERTPEPTGGAPSPSGRLFVVQKHAASRLHYDLRLEMNGVLLSWAVPKGPSLDTRHKQLAVHTEDHPMAYASFEGVIPPDEYGGGTVMVWDRGLWAPKGDAETGYADGDLKFVLQGEKLRGEWVLARMSGDASDGGKNWLLIKKKDEHARPIAIYNVLGELPRSVHSGRSLDEIAAAPEAVWTGGGAQPMEADERLVTGPDLRGLQGARPGPAPEVLKPQLATSHAAPPDGEQWLHEVKFDGYRLMTHIDADGRVRVLTRNGHDWTDRFGILPQTLARLPVRSAVLDGEVVVLDASGRSDFGALQNAFRGGRDVVPFTYFVFDVPFAGGMDLRRVPLLDRKTYLKALLESAPTVAPGVQYCDHMVGRGPFVYAEARRWGLEGIVCKRADAKYESRRSQTWLKVKCTLRQEFVVGGFSRPSGSRTGLGSLLLGVHDDDGRLVYCGRVGTGFDQKELTYLHDQCTQLKRTASAFSNPEADPEFMAVTWVDPKMVVEVEFTAWTNDGLVRHAVYRGVRQDVQAQDVVAEPVPGRGQPARSRSASDIVVAPSSPDDAFVGGVRISHPRRTVYPDEGVSKQQLAAYYLQVADWILPHLVGRPLSLVRCPLGLAGESFYQRQVGEGFPASIRGGVVGEEDSEPYLLIDDVDGLLSLVQMGVMEVHIWGCRADNLERPDHLVFDLDPGPGITWEDIVESAKFIRHYLDDLGLQSFVKTTGGKGVHLVVPITRRTSWSRARSFTHAIANDLVRIAPRNFVATMSKQFRDRRIFVDYLRNVSGSTAVAPYSTRARDGACVSTPLRWDELSADVGPGAYTVLTVPGRLEHGASDPWDGYDAVRQSITKAMFATYGL